MREVSSHCSSRHLGIQPDTGWTIRVFEGTVEPVARFVVLAKGDVAEREEPILMRAQRAQVLGDVFGDPEDDSSRMRAAIRQIDAQGSGLFMYVLGAEFRSAPAPPGRRRGRSQAPGVRVPRVRARSAGATLSGRERDPCHDQ